MIRELSGVELEKHALLAHSMFLDRARQFKHRQGWDLELLPNGEERDEYDLPHTRYIIVEDEDGLHAGSMRLLPTTGNTMISDHFQHMVENVDIFSPLIWECTRFCISEDSAQKRTALELFGAGAAILERYELVGLIAIFDPLVERIYKRYGVSPEVLGIAKEASGKIVKLGIWHNDNLTRGLLYQKLAQEREEIETTRSNMGATSKPVPLRLIS